MKIERETNVPTLPLFLSNVLPSSLTVLRRATGYSYEYFVLPKRRRLWRYKSDRIAEVESDTRIRMFRPEYLSDMQDAVGKYEAETKREVTIVVPASS